MAKERSKKKAKKKRVTFVLEAPTANEVILVGDFNNWDGKTHPMKMSESGIWKKIVVLEPGKYEYKFLVDGQWLEEHQNVEVCLNRFGTYNSILHIS